MPFQNLIHGKKQETPKHPTAEKTQQKDAYAQELQELAVEMACGYGMLPPCGFPDGIWHLY